MTSGGVAVDSLAAASSRFVDEWRDAGSAVRREARARLSGGLWSEPVIEQALDNAFHAWDGARVRETVQDLRAHSFPHPLRALVILPGNVIGPALHAALSAAMTGTRVLLKAASTESVLADIVERQWNVIGAPLAGTLQALSWKGGDVDAEARAVSEADIVIAFGSDATLEAVRSRLPSGKRFKGHGTLYSAGVVSPNADLTTAAEGAALDVCVFDQAGCMSPQTIYVVGDASRALRFAAALDAAMEQARLRLPRTAASPEEAAASADVLRRAYVTALPAATHGLAAILSGPDNNGAPDHLIVVEPQGPPTNHGFGRIAVVKPLEFGREPVLTKPIERLGVAGTAADEIARALWGDRDELVGTCVTLGTMQQPAALKPDPLEFTAVRSDVV
ncbi:MAG TPA: aldehyde dehydrogenase family protein [Candidatus Eremiobacteraceae bacterium]|nr:aldehyde dehydrogenase family protein [Candidatus Eremiobacteraceae bacterium]